MNSIVCYTCVTGEYDHVRPPKVVSKGIDYICFTDNQQLKLDVWQTRPMPDELNNLSNVKKQRVVKACPHKYLKEYDTSIWIDGNIEIKADLQDFIQQYDLSKCPFYTRVHPCRKCIYDEAKACIMMKKDNASVIQKQVNLYKKEGYPRNIGMVETCVILRKHNDIKCQLVGNYWASEILLHSHRDQLSFNYVCWKMHFLPGILKNEFKINSNDTFRIYGHGKR